MPEKEPDIDSDGDQQIIEVEGVKFLGLYFLGDLCFGVIKIEHLATDFVVRRFLTKHIGNQFFLVTFFAWKQDSIFFCLMYNKVFKFSSTSFNFLF